jgi:DNA topoisomerase-1
LGKKEKIIMASSLVIVESPAKARTLNKILGKDFQVLASIGHVKDLPEKELGVEVEDHFAPKYVVIPGKEKIIRELKTASKKAERVFLAPDPDREGEAIAYHIATEIGDKKSHNGKIYRVSFHEITDRAVKEAMAHPGKIDTNKVEAQQARRILDRLVGYKLSPLLWRKVRRGLSAGRVQSVAVRLIVDREREIEKFIKQEYWTIEALLAADSPPPFGARLHSWGGELVVERGPKEDKFLLRTEGDAAGILSTLKERPFAVRSIEKKKRKKSPPAPFRTSTLQQEAFNKLGFTAKKTMMLAQQLYEGIELGGEGPVGLITYMRTDSVRVAPEAQDWARKLIIKKFGEAYAPPAPPKYKGAAGAQEAHECIRPTYAERPPEGVKQFLGRDQLRLYTLIWNRFVASQMAPAELEQTTVTIKAEGSPEALFRTSGGVIKFDGFLKVLKEGAAEEGEAVLPALEEGARLDLKELKPAQHFTQPPPRYSEASLVKALEEKGIGRPSTYAAILSTIQDRKYVEKETGRLKPTDLGVLVNDLLVERFPDLMDVSFTARMEDDLDLVESGDMEREEVIKEFYEPFSAELEEAMKIMGKVRPQDVPTELKCERCGLPMVKRWGKNGWFLACTGYPECKYTCPVDEPKCAETNEVCEKCGSPMIIKSGRFGKFLACSNYPACKNTKAISLGIKCPQDGGDVVERRSKKGKLFYTCSNYPNCKFISWYKPVNRACPLCGGTYLLEKKGREGTVIFCPNKSCAYKEEPKEEAKEA